jgi:class 3 adenylate cyclase
LATNTLTVVFTDLANYTQSVAAADRVALRNLISEHERFVTPILTKHRGTVVKNLGDSFMALFPSATDALRAGLEAVEEGLKSGGLLMRVSCATGDVEEIDGDAFGDAVNLSARINSRTPAGEVWFSESTRQCMNQSEIPWEPVGSFSLKGISGDMSCHRAVTTGGCTLPPPIRQAIKAGSLVRIKPGQPPPPLHPDPTLLFEGFQIGRPELARLIDSLPVLDPARLWLGAYKLSPADRHRWERSGRGLVVARAGPLHAAIVQCQQEVIPLAASSHTIILDMDAAAEIDLVMAGMALPMVPLADVVAGYSYDLLPEGRWVNRSSRAVLRIDVTSRSVTARSLSVGVTISGKTLSPSAQVDLVHGAEIRAAGGPPIRFYRQRDMSYAGLLVADSPLRMGVARAQVAEMGREPNHPGLALPDRGGQENIRWCSGPRAARAREGGFTLDRALAGRRQAAVEVSPDGRTQIRSLHSRCPTWLYRDGAMTRVEGVDRLTLNDLIVTGTSIIAIRSPLI